MMRGTCLKSGCAKCKVYPEEACRNCGFYTEEARRRKKIPLTKDAKSGLCRKVIARRKEKQAQ